MDQHTIGRLNSLEFFATIPPGLFILLVCHAVLSAGGQHADSLWDYLVSLSDTLQQTPAAIVFLLFGAYLFGSIIRSLPVRWAEMVITRRLSKFPYLELLERAVIRMKSEAGATNVKPERLPVLDGFSSEGFNYWKDAICIHAPGAFAYYQTFEARTRFFTGMFWAGAVGVIGSIAMFAQTWRSDGYLAPSIELAVISIALVAAFGFQLRHVREEEARVLMTLYAVLAQQESSSAKPISGA